MSCRRSRKSLYATGNPTNKILQVLMWILPWFMLNWSICHISNSFGEIFVKRIQNVLSLIESSDSQFAWIGRLRNFTRGENWTNLLFRREPRSVWINFSIKKLIACLFVCLDSGNFFTMQSYVNPGKPWESQTISITVPVYKSVKKPKSSTAYQIRQYDNTNKLRCTILALTRAVHLSLWILYNVAFLLQYSSYKNKAVATCSHRLPFIYNDFVFFALLTRTRQN